MSMKKLLGLLVFAMVILTMSCQKYLDRAYKNPNLPTYAAPEQVLQSCINGMHRGIAFDARMIGMVTQNFASVAGVNSWERHGYAPSSDNGGDIWRMHYWNMGFNIIDMIDSCKRVGKYDYVAAAFALNAWSWVTVADVHGELPVKQAFEKGRLSFDYDNQNVAYETAMKYCDSSLYYWNLSAGMAKSTLADGDLYFFGGDQAKWKKFVYGVKARIYHRYIAKADYKADSVIKYADLAMSSSADDAMVKFNIALVPTEARNFFGPTRNNVGGFRIGAFPANIMNGTIFGGVIDPRAKFIMKPSSDGIFRGITCNQQADNSSATQKVFNFWGFSGTNSAPSGGVDTGARTFFKNDSKFPIMTYSEMQFLKAEAALKAGRAAVAKAAYVNGISGHIDMLRNSFTGYTAISDADKASFLANPNIVPVNDVDLTLRHIMCQKYLSLWGWGFVENWVDMRRHNYDEVNIYPTYTRLSVIALYPDNGGKLCERFRPRYNSEYLWNIDALTKVGGFNLDYHTKKCWFSQP